jgi:hypothetical protein
MKKYGLGRDRNGNDAEVRAHAEETLARCLREANSGTMVIPVSPQLEKILNPFPLGERRAAE